MLINTFPFLKGDVFQFIPSEGKEIVINTKSLQVENLGEVFVFQRGNRFIRLPLYQLLLISDLHIHLTTILEGTMGLEMEVETLEVVTLEAVGIIEQLEADNRLRMIDYALETDNIQMFNELTEGLQQN